MRSSYNNAFSFNNEYVKLKDQDWLDKQRIAGKVVAGSLNLLQKEVDNKTQLSLLQLNNLAEQYIFDNKCEATFKNYKSFPAGVCISVNKQLVHGIPIDYILQDGDIVSFDLGATFESAIADAAITTIFGTPKSQEHIQLVKDTEDALMSGIKAIQVGKRIGCIGDAISKVSKGYGLITQYGGHGLDWNKPHDQPFISNKSSKDDGIRIEPGMTLAIEPMFVLGSSKTYVDKDGWTVYVDGISAHWEHTVFIHEDRVEIITDRTGLK